MTFPFLNRIDPKMGPEGYKTYELRAPISTHRRQATCQETNCEYYRNGWRSGFDLSNPEAAKAAKWIRMQSGYTYTVEQMGTKLILTFAAGQQCIEGRAGRHTVSLEREPFYVVRGGDYRGNPRQIPLVRRNEADWVDDFANHQDRLATRLEQG